MMLHSFKIEDPSGAGVPLELDSGILQSLAHTVLSGIPFKGTSTSPFVFVYVLMQRENVGNKSDILPGSSNLKLQGCRMQPGLNESR